MGKLLGTVILILLVINAAAGVILLGYGMATGRFGTQQIEQYLATWRGEELVPPPEEIVEEADEESPRDASARIAAAEIEREISAREVQLQLELLRKMEVTVRTAQDEIEKRSKKLQVAEKRFEEELARQQQQAADEGFRKAVEYYSDLNPKLAKEDLMSMPDEEAVRYLAAMKRQVASEILNRFRNSSEEQQKRVRLMRLLQEQGQIAVN